MFVYRSAFISDNQLLSSDFETMGFLSNDADAIRRDIHDPKAFAMARELNAFACKYRNSLTLDYCLVLSVVLICLFQRILDAFSALE